uniref:Uncharacterized protein n=1 Tax=Anopheles culicifacies TaxID=139723 RepID=A0A182M9A8_9DIPT
MGEVKRTIVMCLLVMSLLVVSFTREVNAAPQQKNTEVPDAPGTTTKRSAYSPIADIGRLAQGTAGMFGQFWNTGARLGGEFSRRAFEFLKVKNPHKSQESSLKNGLLEWVSTYIGVLHQPIAHDSCSSRAPDV